MKLYVRTNKAAEQGLDYDRYLNAVYEFKPTGEFVVETQDGFIFAYAPNTIEGYHICLDDRDD